MEFSITAGTFAGFKDSFFEYWFFCEECLDGYVTPVGLDLSAMFFLLLSLFLFLVAHYSCRALLKLLPTSQHSEETEYYYDENDLEDDEFDDAAYSGVEDDEEEEEEEENLEPQIEERFKKPYIAAYLFPFSAIIILLSVALLNASFWVFGTQTAGAYSTTNAILVFGALTTPISILQEIWSFLKLAFEKVTGVANHIAVKALSLALGVWFLYLYIVSYFDVLSTIIGVPNSTILWATLLPPCILLALLIPVLLKFARKIRTLRSILRV